MSTSTKTRVVGAPVFRKEGVDKLLGRARYVDDLESEGMWHGATVRSTIPRGFIRDLHFDPRIDWNAFAVVTAFDIAEYSAENGITVWGSMQCPFYVHKSLMAVFNLPEKKVRVIQTETGGAFGGKEDFPSTICAHAALLAMKSGHPVKLVYDRMEDLAATTKRHPARVRHRTAVDNDGKLLAMDIELTTDGGAYATLSSTVLSRATLHSPGPSVCPNVRVRSHA